MAFLRSPSTPLVEAEPDDPLANFRSDHPGEVLALLRELRDRSTPVVLSAPDGGSIGASIGAVDEVRQRVAFEVESGDPRLPGLVEVDEVTVVGYLHAIKLQFELEDLVLVRGPRATILQARMPHHVYRFQRRTAYRVRTLEHGAPVARMRHPGMPDMEIALRIVDISIGGCALLLPEDVPPLQPGSEINRVTLELDTDTELQVGLRIQHATSMMSDVKGLQLGCEFLRGGDASERMLQRFIDQTQKRRRLLSLD